MARSRPYSALHPASDPPPDPNNRKPPTRSGSSGSSGDPGSSGSSDSPADTVGSDGYRTSSGDDGSSRTGPAPAPGQGEHRAPGEPEVLVVGAGPTGLLLAGDLAAAGRRVTLVEERDAAVGNLTRALVVHARTLEQLDARGLADELVEAGHPIDRLRLFGNATLHPTTLPTRFPFVLIVGQYVVERLLERRARAAGVDFRYGARMTALRHRPGGVEIEVRQPDGVHTLRAGYLVGADGAHSTVRRELGVPFPGRPVLRSLVLADVRLDAPPHDPFVVSASGQTFALVGSFGDGWYRVMGWDRNRQLPDDAPVELAEVRETVRSAMGSDFGMRDPRWISRFRSDERQAPAYRVGRAFLAGDAAHVHSPAGGLGLNTGLQDAANLSWKLVRALEAAQAAGGEAASARAADALLDTYEAERRPIGALMVRTSGALVRLGLLRYPGSGAVRTLAATAVNRVRALNQRAMGTVSGIHLSYPPASPGSQEPHRRGRRAPLPGLGAAPAPHPLTGKRVPDLRLTSGRLYEALREGRFVLVTPRGAARRPADRRFVQVESAGPGRRTLLVRPDAHIAWAAEGPEPAGLEEALTAWTGPPTARGRADKDRIRADA
ncbi:FAD-dependent monooxygenase [Streptomyces cacaoi]|uniref:FAD-dependent monooxygenase n=1 Tax=Streptomyces cacaoi TaxID=1898 RepID=UPI0011F2462F|nr:FAD-dependent monooxygenase [Streptomyces cacaoi]